MSQIKATFTGGIVAEPERKDVNGAQLLTFPVYVNHTKKNKETGAYDKTGDVSKIRVSLWRDLAATDVQKGDLVEIVCTIIEKEFPKADGTTGRSLQTDWVESVVVKHRSDGAPANNGGGFASNDGF